MRYRSKKDTWVASLLYGSLLLPLILGIFFLFLPGIPRWTGWLILFIGIATGAFTLALTFPMYYEIAPPTLRVRSGLIRWERALDTIQEVFPTHNPLSAPAWSLDRLQVNYRKDSLARFILISPEDQIRFMHDLATNEEDLEVRAGCVVRRH